MTKRRVSSTGAACALTLVLGACSGADADAEAISGDYPDGAISGTEAALAAPPTERPVAEYEYNARRGRILFVAKGCVLCHSVNGVGGAAAPALNAPANGAVVDGYAFSTRMWRGAPAMVALQRLELGYQIELDGQDLADLAAFVVNADEQQLVTLDSLPEGYEGWFVNMRFWDDEEWGEYLERGDFPDLGEYEGGDFDRE
ncbi:MAG: c-type cytochrome [Pseudomonadota bacterium]